MMKQLLAVFFIAITSTNLFGEYVPNGGFEDWDTVWMYREPVLWNTGNLEVYTYNYLPAVRTEDNYSGDYALRLHSATYEGNVAFGYVFTNGMISNTSPQDTIEYSGGFPITDKPDSLHGYFKYHIASGDTAVGLISFKKSGKVIYQGMIRIYGSTSQFIKLSFEIGTMTEVPDTAMLGLACTNAFVDPVPGNWLIVDSLWFTGTTDTIPNSDFETWDEIEYIDPTDWLSLNELIALNSGKPSATLTTDAHSGNSALRLESLLTINPFSIVDSFTTGILLPQYGGGSFFNEGYNFPLTMNPSSLTGFYKFIPAGDDIGGVSVTLIDINGQLYSAGALLNPVNIYTPFEVSISYPLGTIIQEIRIAFTTNYEDQGIKGSIGSVLYIDDLNLVDPCEGQPDFEIQNISTSRCDPQTLDAGASWDYYSWSTNEYTRTIEIEIPDDYSVLVTDNTTGCYRMDTIFAGMDICDGIDDHIGKKSSFEIYPVPALDYVNINFVNMVPGNYTLEITAITGSVIRTVNLTINEMNKARQLSVSDLTTGLYFIKITGEKFSQIEKLKVK